MSLEVRVCKRTDDIQYTVEFSWSRSEEGNVYWFELYWWQMAHFYNAANTPFETQSITDKEAQKRSAKLLSIALLGDIE